MFTLFSLDTFLAAGFIIFGLAFGIQAWYYNKLRDVVFVSYKDATEILVLLANYDNLETHAEKIARFLRLELPDISLELKREDIIKLISKNAQKIVIELKANVPETKLIIEKVEKEILG